MADEGEKKLSKKELKKLAKKAEKAQKKNGGGGGGGASTAPAGGGASSKQDAGPAPAAKAATPSYRLANVPSDGQTDACTLKACAASVLYGVPLLPGGVSDELSFVKGPALLYGGPADPTPAVAFGGNGIIRALALAGPAEVGQRRMTAEVDDWLEFERAEFRPALASGNERKVEKALAKIEAALEEHQTSVTKVGGCGTIGPADLAISLTLMNSATTALSPTVATYLDITRKHPAIASARKLAGSLLPPPPYDPSNPSLLAATSAVFASGILSAFPSASSLGVELKSFKCKDMKHGDYQCNAAMPLFQKLKAAGALPDGVSTPQQVFFSFMAHFCLALAFFVAPSSFLLSVASARFPIDANKSRSY